MSRIVRFFHLLTDQEGGTCHCIFRNSKNQFKMVLRLEPHNQVAQRALYSIQLRQHDPSVVSIAEFIDGSPEGADGLGQYAASRAFCFFEYSS
jgi:hypothetical protein